MSLFIEQHVSPRIATKLLDDLGIPQVRLAEFADMSTSDVSLWFSGKRNIGTKAQRKVVRALKFFQQVAAEANGIPVNFNSAELQARWVKFLRTEEEAEIRRVKADLQAQAS